MVNYKDPKYEKHCGLILHIQKRVGWEKTKYHNKETYEDLVEILERLVDDFVYPEDLTPEIWLQLWEDLKNEEENNKSLIKRVQTSTIVAKNTDNGMTVPQNEKSSWQLYKKSLLDNSWTEPSVDELEVTCEKFLKKLNSNTAISKPIKGLVVGNVQSGKTANMAGLMAMAADWGWNMFIVLSGTIENLRKQTESRLMNDLNKTGNVTWQRITKPAISNADVLQTSQLHFEEESRSRYLIASLKNSKRLESLNKWLANDKNKLRQMKILVIDDEADQASINTNDVFDDSAERTKINQEIVNLVQIGIKENVQPTAMNYVSYTATPYANFLNEAKPEALYPEDFIGVLSPAKEYFGPKQIFGLDESEDDRGLRNVLPITLEDNEIMDGLHKEELFGLPESFKEAIHWFFCATASMRYAKYKKPISMLVHTSQKQAHHEIVANAIKDYINRYTEDQWIELCKKTYEKQTKHMTLRDFDLDFAEYPFKVDDYFEFDRLEDGIRQLKSKITPILLDRKEEKLKYHDGIHLCIDNCANNGITEENEHMRLAYPESDKKISPAPAFLIIGGSTLARGLTIEGLVSTYFLRTTKTADTLMQMGRWFGYRRGYEMYPRIWMTEDTKSKFAFLSQLDYELREELKTYELNGTDPAEYGPKIKNSPMLSWMQVTASSRQQGAVETNLDFSGTHSQTTVFDNDNRLLRQNIETTEAFLGHLGQHTDYTRNKNGLVWRDVDFKVIREQFLEKFKFNSQAHIFNKIEELCKWYEAACEKIDFTGWNIVVAGTGKVDEEKVDAWYINNQKIGKISRSRLNNPEEYPDFINIKALRTANDLYADISAEVAANLPADYSEFSRTTIAYVNSVRKAANLDKTPQLIIYRVNKNSKAQERSERYDLSATEDLIGINLFIPGQASNSLAQKVAIYLPQWTDFSSTEGGN